MHDTGRRHGAATIGLHWASAALLVAGFGLGLMLEDWPRGAQRDTAMMVHYSIGTVVLGFVLVRLLRRLLLAQPPAAAGMSRPARLAAQAMHWGLYAVMVALPLTGALDRWARGRRLAVFDIVVPAPFPVPGGRLWREAHEILGYVLAAMVLAHVGAALWHAVVRRDAVLARMLPARRRLAPALVAVDGMTPV